MRDSYHSTFGPFLIETHVGMRVDPGVPLQTLYGFDKVHVPAGKTVTVELYPALDVRQDQIAKNHPSVLNHTKIVVVYASFV